MLLSYSPSRAMSSRRPAEGQSVMPRDLLTFALEGDVDLLLFPDAMTKFRDLVQTLSEEIAGPVPITWAIDGLAVGSAVVTVRGEAGEADKTEAVERVVSAYAAIGKALEKQEPIPYSERV